MKRHGWTVPADENPQNTEGRKGQGSVHVDGVDLSAKLIAEAPQSGTKPTRRVYKTKRRRDDLSTPAKGPKAVPEQTMFFLDWDDTLFPTTELFDRWGLPSTGELPPLTAAEDPHVCKVR